MQRHKTSWQECPLHTTFLERYNQIGRHGNRELHFYVYFFAATMITSTTGRYNTEACSRRPARTFEPETASLPT